jgi:membrane-bound lytic murein transglycosylase B
MVMSCGNYNRAVRKYDAICAYARQRGMAQVFFMHAELRCSLRAQQEFSTARSTFWFMKRTLFVRAVLFISATVFVLMAGCSTLDPITAERLRTMERLMKGTDVRFRSAVMGLLARNADTAFISTILLNPNTVFLEKMVKINVTGFLKKADYSHNYNAMSMRATREFFAENADLLRRVQDSTGVPSQVITAILWVETKFGTVLGTYNVVSVYASLAAAAEPQNIEANKQAYRSTVFSPDSLNRLDSMVETRARRKANWAIDQLMALKSMQDRLPFPITDLRGSWAGAFGWPQFIPSSFMSWAVDGNGDGKVSLFDKEDAMASVGNYLKVNGWGEKQSQQEAAVYHYNNSKDYVQCVLTLAEKIVAQEEEK